MIGVPGLSCLPVLLALTSPVSVVLMILCAFATAPMAIALLVSRTGNLDAGKSLLLVCLALFMWTLASSLTGTVSFVLLLACLLPIEAVLWGCRSPIRHGGVLAALVCTAFIVLPPVPFTLATSEFSMNGSMASVNLMVVAAIYGLSVAWRMHGKMQSQSDKLKKATHRSNLYAAARGELITQHDVAGATLFASPAARDLLGVSAADLLKNGLVNRVHLQDRVVLLKAFSDAVQGRDQHCRVRLRVKNDEGRLWKWVEARCIGQGQTVTCVTRDISDIHRLEQELQAAAALARNDHHAQRQFLATISHELRTPLNAIVGFSDVLQQELFGKFAHKKHREYVGLIQESGHHLLNVVNGMLDMSRIEAGKYELTTCRFSIADIVEPTLAMLRPTAVKGQVELTTRIATSLPDIVADKRACQQILINLLSNAIKFTTEGGVVQLSARQFGRSVRISVKDNGIGMAGEFLSRIGEPFTQADQGAGRNFEGTGIGLSVVKGLVALHGGEFDIKSRLGEGTSVTVTLPLANAASQPVPSDHGSQLIHLSSQVKKPDPAFIETELVSKGDRRARVSA